jgi:hypothetical protein
MLGTLWLEASKVEGLVTFGLVSLVQVTLLEKDCLERLFPFLVGTSNQDAFCFADGWRMMSLCVVVRIPLSVHRHSDSLPGRLSRRHPHVYAPPGSVDSERIEKW